MDKWIQRVHPRKGFLHRQMGVKPEEKIPTAMLRDIVNTPVGSHTHGMTVTRLLKQRANFALNMRK